MDSNLNTDKQNGKIGQVPIFPEINSGGTHAILASMFRKILHELSINPIRWNHLMNTYLLDPKNGIKRNNKDQSSARGNLQKELLKEKMTWKVFCKGIRFLNIMKFEIIIRAHHSNGKVTEHLKSVSLGSMIEIEEENSNSNSSKEKV